MSTCNLYHQQPSCKGWKCFVCGPFSQSCCGNLHSPWQNRHETDLFLLHSRTLHPLKYWTDTSCSDIDLSGLVSVSLVAAPPYTRCCRAGRERCLPPALFFSPRAPSPSKTREPCAGCSLQALSPSVGLKRVMAIAGGHVPLHRSFAGTWCFALRGSLPRKDRYFAARLPSSAPNSRLRRPARPGPAPAAKATCRGGRGQRSHLRARRAAGPPAAWRGSGPGRRSRLSSDPPGGSSSLRLRWVLVPSRLPLTAPGSAQGTGSAPADPPAAPGSHVVSAMSPPGP